jgi:hypothetical protein
LMLTTWKHLLLRQSHANGTGKNPFEHRHKRQFHKGLKS